MGDFLAEQYYKRYLQEMEENEKKKSRIKQFLEYFEETYGFKKGEKDGNTQENETQKR